MVSAYLSLTISTTPDAYLKLGAEDYSYRVLLRILS